MEEKSLGSVKLSRLEKIISAVKLHQHDDIDIDISAEFLIPSCFPGMWKNFQENTHLYYTQGYIDGRKSMEEEYAANINS